MANATSPPELRFQSGGTLRADSFYARRPADEQLLAALLRGEYCYVLAPRQIGKSSLRLRTEQRLRAHDVLCATIDLTRIGSRDVTADEWYHSLADEIADRLALQTQVGAFWERHRGLSPVHRFARFLRDVLLALTQAPVVLFIDEIDAVLGLSFSMDDFFGMVRACYNDRAELPQYGRLTFCLLGAAAAADLTQDAARTPFNVGRNIRLNDLTAAEAAVFLPGLERLGGFPAEALLAEVLRWTGGHPYMTQRVCEELTRRDDALARSAEERVARVVREVFLLRGRVEDQNLAYAEKRLRSEPAERTRRLLAQYRQLLEGAAVSASGDDAVQTALRLCGLAADRLQDSGEVLQVRNRIFATVFDAAWVDATLAALTPAFQAGGGLRPGALYVERAADGQLAAALDGGEFCAVLAPSTAGKTSLLYRALAHLGGQGRRCAYVNLVELGLHTTAENWTQVLCEQVARQLLPGPLGKEQPGRTAPPPTVQGWLHFFATEILPQIQQPIVLAFDDIDAALQYVFDAEFFEALYALYQRRGADPAWQRIRLGLCGDLNEELLQRRAAAKLLSVCRRLALDDFNWREAKAFVPGLRELGGDPQALVDAVLAWTGGQPYQTQRICMALLEQGPQRSGSESDRVDKAVEELFLRRSRFEDAGLGRTARLVEQHPQQSALLALHRRVLRGERVLFDAKDPLHTALLRVGLLSQRQSKGGSFLIPHNRIYAAVFHEDWSPDEASETSGGLQRLAVGQVVAGYRLLRLMKEGELGPAFEAVSEQTGARIAAHFIPRPDASSLSRTETELLAIQRLHHPGLLDTLLVTRLDRVTLLLVRPYLDGTTLEQALERGGLRTPGEALTLGTQLADVFATLHDLGVAHRNLKPSKIMLMAAPGGQSRAKLMGLGLLPQRDVERALSQGVEHTRDFSFLGSPQYMAPEQFSGQNVGPPTDVYQLGLILYELFAGAKPFVSDNALDLMILHSKKASAPLHEVVPLIPSELSLLIQDMLAKSPEQRPPMAAVLGALQRIAARPELADFFALPLPLPRVPETPGPEPLGQIRSLGMERASASPGPWIIVALLLLLGVILLQLVH
jgi:serine/threonine protein kinase